jgi:hypothetical protein
VARKPNKPVRLDLNSPRFLAKLFALSKDEKHALLKTLEKISRMSWSQVYQDRGLKWEVVAARSTTSGDRVYSFRCSRSSRALAMREGDYLVLLSLHPDHDSAYE